MKNKAAKKKPAARKVKKKAPGAAAGDTGRGSGDASVTEIPAPPLSAQAAHLGTAIEKTEKALDKTSRLLADARERVVRTAETARLKRTEAALAVADRAREEVAVVNKHRLDVVIALRAAREAVGGAHDTGVDWDALAQALSGAVERYEEVLESHDRRVRRRGREQRNG